MKISLSHYVAASACGLVLFLFLATPIVYSQAGGSPFGPPSAREQALLKKRLKAYTKSYRQKDWGGLYDLVSETNKNGLSGEMRLSKSVFIHEIQNTYDTRKLLQFRPARFESAGLGTDVYGCGTVPNRGESIVAVRAVWENGNWFFTDWAYTDPLEPCSRLSDPAWKPQIPLRLNGPMMEVLCLVRICEI